MLVQQADRVPALTLVVLEAYIDVVQDSGSEIVGRMVVRSFRVVYVLVHSLIITLGKYANAATSF